MRIDLIHVYSEDDIEVLLSRLFDGVDDTAATPEQIKERISSQLIVANNGYTYFLSDLQEAYENDLNLTFKLSKQDTSPAPLSTAKYHPNQLVHNKPLAELLYAIHTSKHEKRFHFELPTCPITSAALLNPCITHSEQSIEGYAFEEHIATHGENPYNRQKLSKDKILRNYALQFVIQLRLNAIANECLDLYDTVHLHSDFDEIKDSLETATSFYNTKINELEFKRTNENYYLREYHQQFGLLSLGGLDALSREMKEDIEKVKERKNVLPIVAGSISSILSLVPVGALIPATVTLIVASAFPIVPVILAGVALAALAIASAGFAGKYIHGKVEQHYEKKLASKSITQRQLGYYTAAKERDNALVKQIEEMKQTKDGIKQRIDGYQTIKNKLPPLPKAVEENKNVLSTSKDTLLASPKIPAAAYEKEVECAVKKGFRN